MPKTDFDGSVVGFLSIPSTELSPSGFVDIRPPEGQTYLLTIGVISGLNGGCFVSIRDITGGIDIFSASAGNKSAGGFAVSNHSSWIRISNVDSTDIASYAATGIVLRIATLSKE